jgi:HNH endonuclease
VNAIPHYARSGAKIDGKQIFMHHFLLGVATPHQVDHRDADGLNNRCNNIRVCTSRQNNQNKSCHSNNRTSQYKGVRWDMSYDRKNGIWRADIRIDGKTLFLGYFTTEKLAVLAYSRAAEEHFGVFAKMNRIEDTVMHLNQLKRIARCMRIIRAAVVIDPSRHITNPTDAPHTVNVADE